jgi:hypothetical protein
MDKLETDLRHMFTCHVCGEAWDDHGLGGNCKQLPHYLTATPHKMPNELVDRIKALRRDAGVFIGGVEGV